jgi:S-adenosylmethionine decarboxylase
MHCWPEAEYAALDVLLCGSASKLNVVAQQLKQGFAAREIRVREQKRGDDLAPVNSPVAAGKKEPAAKAKSRIRKAA